MSNLGRLFGLGFLPTLMGYFSAARSPAIERVIALALDQRYGVQLSPNEAQEAISIARQARAAASRFLSGVPLNEVNAPAIPQTPPSPNLSGGDGGQIEIGLIAKPPGSKRQALPIVFSLDVEQQNMQASVHFPRTSPGQPGFAFPGGSTAGNLLDDLIAFLEETEHGDNTVGMTQPERIKDIIRPVIEDWLFGGRTALLPNWIVQVVEGTLENRGEPE